MNKRLALGDWDYSESCFILQWVQTLVNDVPALSPYGAQSFELHTESTYHYQLVPVGDDGPMFAKPVQLKDQLQFQETEFQWFDFVMPLYGDVVYGVDVPQYNLRGPLRMVLDSACRTYCALESLHEAAAMLHRWYSSSAARVNLKKWPPHHSDVVQFSGDRTLAQVTLFMNDTVLSHDAAEAVAAGDVGRLWSDLKVCLIPANPGGTLEGGLHGEHFNRKLKEAITRRSINWSNAYLREAILPNVCHFTELKDVWGMGSTVGLA
ncbi:hypothetical protein FKP32DRAFT_1604466 [Trametes sanguinea]|nr:hypothetical protein FKP32DRAFT_1604466 [Trametes sanguinea]